MFKIVHGLSPLYLSQICQPTARSTRYATRSVNNIRVPRCRTSYFKNSFFPSSISYWNSLDYSIRNLDSVSLFKRHIKDKYGYKRPPPHNYSGLRAASIWHTRLRLGMSQLSAHLFPFGFDESPRCSCGHMRHMFLIISWTSPSMLLNERDYWLQLEISSLLLYIRLHYQL